ncbi:head-to-tail adaptor [Gordonia phage TinaLin]|uniref:Head-to-tail adaptor n=1 Tax=Gordonia phage TinaLin TaxID=2797324 RepID=A0A7T7GTW8_9CAUD|nr:head-to-tail adaptor [Gordonia phage TinaLin]QQM15104.1 head-to-tail adaptor [Gordonia phage TinaLin]
MTPTGADLSLFTQGQVPAGPAADKLVAGALKAVQAYCGWHVIGERTEVLTLDGSGHQRMQLPSTYVTNIARITEDGEELPASAYRWQRDGLIRKRVGVWLDEYAAVEVELTHGYADAEDVAGVVLAVAAREATNPLALSSQTVGGMSFSHGVAGGGFMADEYAKLDPYRAVVDG